MSIPNDESRFNRKENLRRLLESQNGEIVGKTPDNVDKNLLEGAGHRNIPLATIIRKKCLNCCCFQPSEVRKCIITDCALWPYRMGKNPFQAEKYQRSLVEQEGGDA